MNFNVSYRVAGTITSPGDDVSWAGVCPWTRLPCVGTESGVIRLYTDTSSDNTEGKQIKLDTEPVNGVAFLDTFGAVTSRHSISIFKKPELRGDEILHGVSWYWP